MTIKRKIGVIDDEIYIASLMRDQLCELGYDVVPFYSAEEFLAQGPGTDAFDLVVSDIYLKDVSGFDLCRSVRTHSGRYVPVILMSGNDLAHERSKSVEVGADDFMAKPFSVIDLHLKIEALLRLSQQLEATRAELGRLEREAAELKSQRKCTMPANFTNLTSPVNTSVFSQWSRKHLSAVFVDLRQFTPFTEAFPPEAVMEVLTHYYSSIGKLAKRFGGTTCSLIGDGIAVVFTNANEPGGHQGAATRFALAAREELNQQSEEWRQKGYGLGFGLGLADGYATIGTLGCHYLSQYVVIGMVMNLASRLCSIAHDGQILASHRFYVNIPGIEHAPVGVVELKGVHQPVTVHNAVSEKKAA